MKKDTQDIIHAKKLVAFLRSKKGFGKTICKELYADCGACQGQILIGFLNWYIDLGLWDLGKKEIFIKRGLNKVKNEKSKTYSSLVKLVESQS